MVQAKSSDTKTLNVSKKRTSPRFSGFTLVELIVVITILAILATVGFLALSGYSQDAKDSAIKANVRSVQTAIAAESAITGNSPRYYVVHDTGAALSGAFVYVDGKQVALSGGAWNDANANYSAGNPDYAKLKMNPEKFKISFIGNVEKTLAAYDSQSLSIGALDISIQGNNGSKRTASWYQVAGVAPGTKMAVVSGNFPQPTASETASWAVSGLVRDPSLSATGAVKDGAVAGTPVNQENSPASGTPISGDDVSWRTWTDGTYANSCKGYVTPSSGYSYQGDIGNGIYWIDPTGGSNSDAFKAYCEMTTDGGGWTLAMKIDGTKTTFAYDATHWTNTTTLNPVTGLGISNTEYKGEAYSALAYSGLLIKTQTGATTKSITLPWSGTSLYAKIQPGTSVTETAVSATQWNDLVPGGYLQTTMMVNGYNYKHMYIGVRIGAIWENTATISWANSMVGLWGWKSGTHADVPAAWARNHDQFPVGYAVGWFPIFAYLYVR